MVSTGPKCVCPAHGVGGAGAGKAVGSFMVRDTAFSIRHRWRELGWG